LLSILLIPILVAVAGVIYAFAPQLASFLIETLLGGELGIYGYLIELPIAARNGTAGTISPVTSIGPAILSLHWTMRTLSFILFSLILVVAGLCYGLENFKVMSEGTASNIVTGGFFTLLLIYATIPIYNAVATLINAVTSPSSGLILKEGMIEDLASTIIRPPPLPGGDGNP